MLTAHPYVTWPLHVKLFTREAVRCWEIACADIPHSSEAPEGNEPAKKPKARSSRTQQLPSNETLSMNMPPGLTVSVELEGVDGKSGAPEDIAIGRGKAIEVTDGLFTFPIILYISLRIDAAAFSSSHLSKHVKLLSQGVMHVCSVCKGDIDLASSDQLTVSVCPTQSCSSIAHLKCLADHFLIEKSKIPSGSVRVQECEMPASRSTSDLIPRGGSCPTCLKYILWGDVIKGCYRRAKGTYSDERQPSGLDDEEEGEIEDNDSVAGESDARPTTSVVQRTRMVIHFLPR